MAKNLDFQTVKHIKEPGRYTDALVKGLHLWVKKDGNKYWILRYTHKGKQQNMSFGPFPRVTIASARIKAQEARDILDIGENPLISKKTLHAKRISENKYATTFKEFALETIKNKSVEWSNAKHAGQWEFTLREYAFPVIGNKSLDEIDMEDILEILTPIWQTKTETASRLRGRLEWILAAATARNLRSGINPALWRGLLQTILPAPKRFKKIEHHAAIPYKEIPEFILKLRGYDCVSAIALEFLILNANRTSEVTDALRNEVTNDLWVIPGDRMKARTEHRVPLCQRSLELIQIAKAMDEDSSFLFSKNGKKLSNMAMTMLLRKIRSNVTVHGFRSAFRDWVSEETNHSPEVAEKALAHTIRNQVEAAYRRGDLLERRRFLMNDWEEYCSSKSTVNVVNLRVA
jgi:integrase